MIRSQESQSGHFIMSDVPGGPQNQQPQSSDNDPRSLSDQQVARLEKLRRLEQSGVDPWGHRIDGRLMIDAVRQQADRIRYRLADGREIELPDEIDGLDLKGWRAQQGAGEEVGPRIKIAGRIVLMRPTGKLVFLNLRDWTGDLQVLIGKGQVGEQAFEMTKLLDLGDWLAVEGRLGRTNTGELTVFADAIEFMTKTMEPPPEKHAGLADPELRQRMRYLDLTYNAGVMDTFHKRIRIVQSVRDTLNRHGYWEIEGPTLHAIAGGAAARPFTTHHNALNMPLFLRIALELHLKRLLVGGISVRHNPEFTMMECYQAFANYETMMELTEQIIVDALRATGQPLKVTWGDLEIDFTPPFQRRTYAELFAEHARVDPEDHEAIARLAKKLGLETSGKHPDVIKSEVFEETVEDQLKGPIFVIDYPASICPLTKRKTGKPEVAERFELFVHGMELANAYTELNDPLLQEQLFRTQLEGMAEEDSMAKMDHDFIRAMRHGMPPAGGLGIGIDRLVMLLTNSRSIRDIVLFPLLRHES
jgi:lysyl-tRNA synthetase class 2